jgi:hypothetical protein
MLVDGAIANKMTIVQHFRFDKHLGVKHTQASYG